MSVEEINLCLPAHRRPCYCSFIRKKEESKKRYGCFLHVLSQQPVISEHAELSPKVRDLCGCKGQLLADLFVCPGGLQKTSGSRAAGSTVIAIGVLKGLCL